MISKLLRIYKKSYGLRQICNISVYIVHSACTVHLLNLPERSAKRDIIHGVRQLEEIAESWLCARRSLAIIDVLARKWDIEMPEEASTVLQRCIAKFGSYAESYKTGQGSKARSRSDVHVSSPAIKVESSDSYVAADQSALQETPVQGLSTFAFSRPLAPQDNRSPVSLTSQMAADFPFMSNRSILDSNGQVSLPSGEITAGQPVMGITPTSSNEPYRYNDGQLTAGHDWCLNDQSQYATGFGNWELIDPAAGPQWISNLPQTSEAAIDMDFGLKSAPLDPSWPMAGFSVLGNLAAYDEKAFGSTAACLSSAPM